MDLEDEITLRIPAARQKLFPLFPNDTQRGDFKIVFKSKVFNLCKAYLRLESGYFNKLSNNNQAIHQIKQNFNEKAFYQILSCFYGASIKMSRSLLGDYYPIIKFLDIESLLSFLRKDVLNNVSQYDLFVVMRIAHKYTDQEMFVVCLQQLQKQSFEQLKLHQFQLLQSDLPLFKLIIKAHDRHRNEGKPGIPYKDIDQIVRDYCDNRGMGDEGYRALKFELINQHSLTSSQYKQIFLDDYIKMKNNPSASTIVGSYPTGQSIIVNNNINLAGTRLETNKLAQSVIGVGSNFPKNSVIMAAQNPISALGHSGINPQYNSGFAYSGVNQMTLEMQNTFQKKQNQELKMKNRHLEQQLADLKKITHENQINQRQNEDQLRNLKQELKNKFRQQVEYKKTIQDLKKRIQIMTLQSQKKTLAIDKLAEQIEQFKKRRPYEQEEENNMIVQSQFLPAHLIGQMMSQSMPKNKSSKQDKNDKRNNQTPNYQQMDQDQLQQLYAPRIAFNNEPVSTPKYNLPKLCQFITSQGFTKHTLTLIYRRSLGNPPKGVNQDLREKKNLLVLINTTSGQNIGGFVSVKIPKNASNYIEDPGAFLFTLTKNQKFKVKKTEAEEAIFMSEQYLIAFGSDLMISNDCLKKNSECSWPSSFEGAKQVKSRTQAWFAGEKQFLIRDIQVYQMGEQEMEMVLV